MVKEKKIYCMECGVPIDVKNDHHCLIATFNRYDGTKKLKDDFTFFHIQCWADYFNKRVENKARLQVQFMQSKAMEIFNNPAIRGLLSQINGSESLFKMLQTDLSEHTVPKEKVIEKIKTWKKKKQKKKK